MDARGLEAVRRMVGLVRGIIESAREYGVAEEKRVEAALRFIAALGRHLPKLLGMGWEAPIAAWEEYFEAEGEVVKAAEEALAYLEPKHPRPRRLKRAR